MWYGVLIRYTNLKHDTEFPLRFVVFFNLYCIHIIYRFIISVIFTSMNIAICYAFRVGSHVCCKLKLSQQNTKCHCLIYILLQNAFTYTQYVVENQQLSVIVMYMLLQEFEQYARDNKFFVQSVRTNSLQHNICFTLSVVAKWTATSAEGQTNIFNIPTESQVVLFL